MRHPRHVNDIARSPLRDIHDEAVHVESPLSPSGKFVLVNTSPRANVDGAARGLAPKVSSIRRKPADEDSLTGSGSQLANTTEKYTRSVRVAPAGVMVEARSPTSAVRNNRQGSQDKPQPLTTVAPADGNNARLKVGQQGTAGVVVHGVRSGVHGDRGSLASSLPNTRRPSLNEQASPTRERPGSQGATTPARSGSAFRAGPGHVAAGSAMAAAITREKDSPMLAARSTSAGCDAQAVPKREQHSLVATPIRPRRQSHQHNNEASNPPSAARNESKSSPRRGPPGFNGRRLGESSSPPPRREPCEWASSIAGAAVVGIATTPPPSDTHDSRSPVAGHRQAERELRGLPVLAGHRDRPNVGTDPTRLVLTASPPPGMRPSRSNASPRPKPSPPSYPAHVSDGAASCSSRRCCEAAPT